MRLDYCHTIRDERLGVDLAVQIECQVEASFEWVAGEYRPTVSGVFVEDKNLFSGGEIAQAMAGDIANAAEDELLRHTKFRQHFYEKQAESDEPVAAPRFTTGSAYSAMRVAAE